MLRLFEMFAGYGGASFALKKAGIPFECVGFSEIDKYAIQCYQQNHLQKELPKGTGIISHNYGDCTKIDPNDLQDFDLLTGGFPCQSFSVAGKGQGELDTRGTLFNEIIRIAEVKKPKYMLLENVKGLTNKKHKGTFEKILYELDRIGYNVMWRVLNSREHGIPQNRERVFFYCYRNDIISGAAFTFPKNEELNLLLKDILEEEVDEKYNISEEKIKQLLHNGIDLSKPVVGTCHPKNDLSFATRNRVNNAEMFAPCLSSTMYKDAPKIIQIGMIKQFCKKRIFETPNDINLYLKDAKFKRGYSIKTIAYNLGIPKTKAEHYFRIDKSRAVPSPEMWIKLKKILEFDESWDKQVTEIYEKEIEFESTRRVYSSEGCSPTISSTNADKLVKHDFKIRKLTPTECFRLMGFLDDDINLDGLSNTQQYKLAGNGWDINLVSKIFTNMFTTQSEDSGNLGENDG